MLSDLKLIIMGNGSAVPTRNANPSSQMLIYRGRQFLIDCGEGTQMQMIKCGLKTRRLNDILISHLHGDHFFGLFGMLSTFHLFGRDKDLNLFAPSPLKLLLEKVFETSDTRLRFKINFFPMEDFKSTPIIETDTFTINGFKLNHSVPTQGFVFREKTLPPKIDKSFVKSRGLTVKQINDIKSGYDFIDDDGKLYSNKDITSKSRSPLSYAYCSDTSYSEEIIEHIKGVKLLYHEATFDDSMLGMAETKKHSTASQAAKIAKLANVEKLILGHFSARFKSFDLLLNEARLIFPNSQISIQGEAYDIV
ncbi:MAG: ribonuclease Z [Marinilabiliales bacterium]|nr:MAG: ribonuclease Z [Marinilabiliales bacterium]